MRRCVDLCRRPLLRAASLNLSRPQALRHRFYRGTRRFFLALDRRFVGRPRSFVGGPAPTVGCREDSVVALRYWFTGRVDFTFDAP